MTIGLLQDMSSPNVTVGYLVPDYEVWNLQYATLTDKAADDFATIPGLAESWEGSEDGLTCTYTLREGLTVVRRRTAHRRDIAYTINRSRDEEWINHYSTVQNLEATALDERTVEIVSSIPDPKLPTMDVYIVPKHIYESVSADDLTSYDALDGVASGQYSLDEWRSGQDWTMVKNPNWYGRDNGIDRIVFRSSPTPTRWSPPLQRGEIDFAYDFALERRRATRGRREHRGRRRSPGRLHRAGAQRHGRRIGDGHPALQDITVRHAIFHAINREGLFQRVNLGLGAVGTTISPSADPSWIPDLGDENFAYDPDLANEMLDEAGYLDTDGDGVREMPDGSRPLTFRYVERSESEFGAAVREFIIGFMEQIGIALDVTVMDDTQLYDAQLRGEYDMFVWGWTPFVDPDPMLSYFTCAQVTTDPDDPGYNDANWCEEHYDELYEQQKVELDPERRREIVARDAAPVQPRSPRTSCSSRTPTCRRTAPTASRVGRDSQPTSVPCCSPTLRRPTPTSPSSSRRLDQDTRACQVRPGEDRRRAATLGVRPRRQLLPVPRRQRRPDGESCSAAATSATSRSPAGAPSSTSTGRSSSSSSPISRQTLRGNLGDSFLSNRPVTTEIREALWPTIFLVGTATVLAMVIGIVVGIYAGWRRRGAFDATSTSARCSSTPCPTSGSAWCCCRCSPCAGRCSRPAVRGRRQLGDRGSRRCSTRLTTWPCRPLTLTLAYIGEYMIVMRSSILDTVNEEYIHLARAKGLARLRRAPPPRRAQRPAARGQPVGVQLRVRAVRERSPSKRSTRGRASGRPRWRRSAAPTSRCCRVCSCSSACR